MRQAEDNAVGADGWSTPAVMNSLTEAELVLVRETAPDRLATLDEDELLDLHARIRRARNKKVKVYRRRAAARVEEAGGRGKAYAKNSRRRVKTEIFEDALARVSDAVAAAARASADTLRRERIAEAPPREAKKSTEPRRRTGSQVLDRQPNHAGIPKQRASTRAVGARRQARKDAR